MSFCKAGAAYAPQNDVRREIPWPDHSSLQLGLKLIAEDGKPSGAAGRRETQERVRQALDMLPAADRDILGLRYLDGFSYKEVADFMAVSEKAAAVRCHRTEAVSRHLADREPAVRERHRVNPAGRAGPASTIGRLAMSHVVSTVGPNDDILGQFLLQFETAAVKTLVLRRYTEQHPDLAEEFRQHAATDKLLKQAAASESCRQPVIPDYEILEKLAPGGMGIVYRAAAGEPEAQWWL